MGTQLHFQKGAQPPQFSVHVYCSQTAGWIKMALGMEVGLGPGYIAPDGDPAPILAYVCSGQMAGWIKIPLGTEVGLGPGHIVLDGDPAPPLFGPCLLWPNGWTDQDVTWYEGRPWAGQHCVKCGPRPIPQAAQPPNFRLMSVVAKRLHGSRCHLVPR